MTRWIVRLVACGAVLVVLLSILFSVLLERINPAVTVGEWQTETGPLPKQFGFVDEVASCRWRFQLNRLGGRMLPSPPEVVLEGVAELSADEAQRAVAAFDWAPMQSSEEARKVAATAASGGFTVDPERLMMATDVERGLSGRSTFMTGELYFDPVSGVLIFTLRKS